MPAISRSFRRAPTLGLLLGLAACGGGATAPTPPPPPPPPTPVASVGVDPGTATLVAPATQQLTATPRDAQGNPLTGRTVTWTSGAQAVATVSPSGLVTAVAPGSATITATSEGRSGTATITVAMGAVIGPQGGTVSLANGAVTITVPAGAVTTPVVIDATPGGTPSGAAPAGWQVVGPVYRISPAGTTFAQPVTVQVKFAAADLPDFAMTGDLGLQQWNGTQWSLLPSPSVNASDYTISATVSSLGTAASGPAASGGIQATNHQPPWELALMAMDPQIALSPAEASVSVFQREAGFQVAVLPRGQGLALPSDAVPPLFRWRTDGPHSSFIEPIGPSDWTTTMSVEYFTTHPSLAQLTGNIDRVVVDVCLTAPDCSGSSARIISQEARINADVEVEWTLFPDPLEVKRGEDVTLRAGRKNNQGQEVALPTLKVQPYVQEWDFEWESTDFHGSLDEGNDPKQPTNIYTAADPFSFPPPRRETVSYTAYLVETIHVREQAALGPTGGKIWTTVAKNFRAKVGEAQGILDVQTDYELSLTANATTPVPGQTITLTATLDPPESSGIAYRFTSAQAQGTLSVTPGTLVPTKTMNYKVDDFPTGGNEVIQVEVVSVVQGAVWEVLATEEVTVTIDPLRPVQFSVITFPSGANGEGTLAVLNVTKVPGATSYEVTAQGFPEATLPLTFSGANATGQGIPVGSIVDKGANFQITLRSGVCANAPCPQAAAYQSTYGGYVYKVKAMK